MHSSQSLDNEQPGLCVFYTAAHGHASCSIIIDSSIILPGLQASIEVTHS